MALTPYTRQEEWYQQMINASTGNYLPSITAQDEGKVLTVESDGSWGVENVPNELPSVGSSDKDKFLHTNNSTGAVEWADAPTELPSVSGADEGKVLTVNNSGEWVAQTPASGGGVLVVTDTEGTLNKTWQEIHDADVAFLKRTEGTSLYTYVVEVIGYTEGVNYYISVNEDTFRVSSADGYPVLRE